MLFMRLTQFASFLLKFELRFFTLIYYKILITPKTFKYIVQLQIYPSVCLSKNLNLNLEVNMSYIVGKLLLSTKNPCIKIFEFQKNFRIKQRCNQYFVKAIITLSI